MAERDPILVLRRNKPGYDEDFAAWIGHQAAAIKAGRFDEIDRDELADEVPHNLNDPFQGGVK